MPKTMQKVYLLLRNNKQTGPHSLEDLLQLNLKPFDLVWVEGRSAGWSYPSEIDALKPYVGEVPAAAVPSYSTESMPSTHPTYTPSDTTTSSSPNSTVSPKTVFVSLPGKGTKATAAPKQEPPASDWDRRVEELRQRAQSYTPISEPREEEPALNTNYARSLNEVEEDYTHWVYQQKAKKKPLISSKQVSTLAIGIVLVGGGYLAAVSLFDGKGKDTRVTQKTQSMVVQENAADETEPVAAPAVYGEEETSTVQDKEVGHTQVTKPSNKEKVKTYTNGPIANAPVQQPIQKTQEVEAMPTVDEPVVAERSIPEPEEPIAAAPKEKKKTLAEKIDGFIEKIASKGKSGTSGEVEEETTKTTPAPGTGERRSTRRDGEGAPAIDAAELARQVEVVANNADNWMMGVKDLKLTVRNHSAVTIKRATIEILYYSENDNLLERKTIQVSGIPPKGRKVVAAPDQRLADHVDFRVVSASADEEAYAQQ